MNRAKDWKRVDACFTARDFLATSDTGVALAMLDLLAEVRAETFRAVVLALDSRVRLLGSTEFPGRGPEYVTGRVDEAIAAANAVAALGEAQA